MKVYRSITFLIETSTRPITFPDSLRSCRAFLTNIAMNKKEVAERLGVSERAVERYASQGKLSVRYEKGQRGDAAVYEEREVKKLLTELDAKRSLVRPAVSTLDSGNDEPVQLARMSKQSDVQSLLAQLIGVLPEQASKERSLTELAVKHLLTLSEASALSGLSRDHLIEAIRDGKLKARKIGRGWKIKQKDLQSYTDEK